MSTLAGTAPTVRTLTTALAARGSVGYLRVESLKVPVVVEDARSVFGRSDYLVRPIGGEGQQWVAADRVRLDAAARVGVTIDATLAAMA